MKAIFNFSTFTSALILLRDGLRQPQSDGRPGTSTSSRRPRSAICALTSWPASSAMTTNWLGRSTKRASTSDAPPTYGVSTASSMNSE